MIDFGGLNYWAILAAWLINMIIGSIWYSPIGFGKRWTALSGVDLMKMPKDLANRAIGFVALSALVQSVVLAVALNSMAIMTATRGLEAGLLLWLGLTAITTVGTTLYSRRGWGYWWLNASFFLVVMAINSVLLATWH